MTARARKAAKERSRARGNAPAGARVAVLVLAALASISSSLASSTALAQGAVGAGAGSGAAGAAAPADRGKQQKLIESAIERRARAELNGIVDDFVSRRIERSDYTLGYDLAIDKKALQEWMAQWNDAEFGVLLSEVQKRPYEALRPLLSQVTINVSFSDRLSDVETRPIVESLEGYFAAQGGNLESVEASKAALPPALPERIARMQVDEAKRQVERAAEIRRQQIQEEKRLELENAKAMKEEKERTLSTELEEARKKLGEMRDQLLTDENLKDRIVKETPILTRMLATGAGIGALFFLALFFLGLLVVFASRSLGSFFVRGTEGLAEALREQSATKEEKKEIGSLEDGEAAPEQPKEDLEEDALVDFDTKPQLREAADQLRAQVIRDTATTAAILSKVVEQEKYGEVVAIFDLLGPELSQDVFGRFTSAAKRLMQRAFFTGKIKRVGSGKLFNRVNEIRTMLATTDVLMRESTDKAFAQVVLSFSDEEIAQAVNVLDVQHSSAMLAVLPPDRMFRILRELKRDRREEILAVLGRTVENGAQLSPEAVSLLTSQLLDEKKLKTQENVRYLKNVVGLAEDEELEAVTKGLEYNARMLLEVIGVRANLDDLWAQPVEVLEGLFSMLELEPGAAVLFAAPDEVRTGLLEVYPERKRALTEDALDNIKSDEAHRERLAPVAKASRKQLLQRLSEMAEAGTVTLQSRQRLLALAEQQEREAAERAASQPETIISPRGGAPAGNLPAAG